MKMSDNLRDLKNNHQDFTKGSLATNGEKNPYVLFSRWFDEALASGELESNACVVSTVSLDLQPSSRIVYLKELLDEAFIFYTNYASQKGKEIQNNPKAIPREIIIEAWDANQHIDDNWLEDNFDISFHNDCRLHILNFLIEENGHLR